MCKKHLLGSLFDTCSFSSTPKWIRLWHCIGGHFISYSAKRISNQSKHVLLRLVMQRSSMKNKKRHYDEVLLFGNHCVRLPSTTLHIQKIEKLHQIKFTWQEPDNYTTDTRQFTFPTALWCGTVRGVTVQRISLTIFCVLLSVNKSHKKDPKH